MVRKPFVTVGMTAYNSERTVGAAIASIVAQTFSDWEMVIVDDGSSDRTAAIAASFTDPRITVHVDGKRKGVPIRRNEVVSKANGRYLAWMDSDDVSYPRRLAREVEYVNANPGVDLVAAGMIVFRGDFEAMGKRSMPVDHETIVRKPYSGFPMSQPTFLGKVEWFRRHRYDERATRADDQDLLLRSHRASTFGGIDEILVGYREDRIDLGKAFRGRRDWVGTILRDAKQHSAVASGLRACAAQAAKISADFIAVSSGLNYALLRHRAAPISAAEREEWLSVVDGVRSSEASR